MNVAYNMDCLEAMRKMKDNEFDLAVVDPPYGISITDSGRLKKYNAKNATWDSETPTSEYFEQLFRVSKNQIIWGGNYFDLPPTKCFFDLGQATAGRCFVCFLRICVDFL